MSVNVILYTKPSCPYCVRAKQLLEQKGIAFTDINVATDPKVYAELKQRTNHHTVPQIFINDQFIGGCDQLYALEREGKLDALLV